MRTIEEMPGEIHLLQEMGAGIYGPPQMIVIPHLDLTIHHVTLGMPVKPVNSDNTSQMNVLIAKAKNHDSKIAATSMSNKCKWLAHRSTLTPALNYACSLHCFNEK